MTQCTRAVTSPWQPEQGMFLVPYQRQTALKQESSFILISQMGTQNTSPKPIPAKGSGYPGGFSSQS